MMEDCPRSAPAAERRIRRELKTVQAMIALYCQGHHRTKSDLCRACDSLWRYTQQRVDRCRFAGDKPTCARCTVHCFKPEMREQIRAVMRYSGPRMIRRHPVLSLLHFLDGRKLVPARKQGGS